MLGYKININYIGLKKNFDIIYFKNLIKKTNFILYFNSYKLSNKDLYFFKNEILKKNLKSFIINPKYLKQLFDLNFKIFSSNMFFIFCNDIKDLEYLFDLLKNVKFFYLSNKYFVNYLNNKNLNNNFNYLNFILFKHIYSIYIIIL